MSRRYDDRVRVDAAAFLAVLDVELAERADHDVGDDGLSALGLELEAAGVMHAASLGRIVYRLRHETSTVAFALVDAILTALDRQDAVDALCPFGVVDDEPAAAPTRGGWKRPDTFERTARYKFTRAELETIYRLHVEHGRSLRSIARDLWQRLGYASASSCNEALRAGFRREGFTARPQSAATASANRARRQRPADESKAAYKRRRRREHGYRDHRSGEWRIAGGVVTSTDPTSTILSADGTQSPEHEHDRKERHDH